MKNEFTFGETAYFLEQVLTDDGPGWVWVRLADGVSSFPVAYLSKSAAKKAAEEDALSLELTAEPPPSEDSMWRCLDDAVTSF